MSIPQIEPKPSGFKCWNCDRENPFTPYVLRMWDSSLDFRCKCGAVYVVRRGEPLRISKAL